MIIYDFFLDWKTDSKIWVKDQDIEALHTVKQDFWKMGGDKLAHHLEITSFAEPKTPKFPPECIRWTHWAQWKPVRKRGIWHALLVSGEVNVRTQADDVSALCTDIASCYRSDENYWKVTSVLSGA